MCILTAINNFSICNQNLHIMKLQIKGIKKGKDLMIDPSDPLAMKMAMIFEGHCTVGVKESCLKYGYTEQRYYQLLKQFNLEGAKALADKKPGSEKPRVRTVEVVNQIVRMRFLDPMSDAGVISQKLGQMGMKVSKRSVERTITDLGLQKKRMF